MPVVYNDAEFKRTLGQLTAVTKRSVPEALNRILFFAARGSARETKKVPKEEIQAAMGEIIKASRTRGGQVVFDDAPRAAVLVQVARRKKGERGLYGPAMAAAVKKFIAARVRSRAFLASGWLPFIKKAGVIVKDKAGAPSIGPGIRQFGKPKGGGELATQNKWLTSMWNSAGNEEGQKRFSEPVMIQEVRKEISKSKAYIERKLKEAWRGKGAKVR